MRFSAAFNLQHHKVTFIFHSLGNLEKFCMLVNEEFPGLMFYIYNRTSPTPPPKGFEPERYKKGTRTLWCPYCGEARLFKKASFNKKYNVCEICGISDSEFNVRKFNQLWESIVITEDGEIQVRKFGKNARKKARK